MNKKAQSVISLHTEMHFVLSENANKHSWLTSKCTSQGDLAGISRKAKGIMSMSLNTFKAYCDEYIDGGFALVNTQRKKINNEISIVNNQADEMGKPQSKLDEALKEIDKLRRNKAILIKAYNDLNRLTVDLIANSEGNSFEYTKHKALFSSYFDLKLAVDND